MHCYVEMQVIEPQLVEMQQFIAVIILLDQIYLEIRDDSTYKVLYIMGYLPRSPPSRWRHFRATTPIKSHFHL